MPLTDEQWENLKQTIWKAEQSYGSYTEYNSDSGAGGAYQFMPDTWREKANLYGFSEYADVPNASYAPPYVQDSVARGWASHLYDKYNGDVRYVLNAWLSGENASDEDYAKGTISTTRSDGDITASEYVDRGLGSELKLNTEFITTNNPDQRVTNTDNLRPEAIFGANTIAYWVYQLFDRPLMITGGAEVGYHAKSSTGHGHEDGWKIDIDGTGFEGGTSRGTEFKSFCNENGWSCNWEDDHWDIDFSGQDSRDVQQGGFSGAFLGAFGGNLSYNNDRAIVPLMEEGYERSKSYIQEEPSFYKNDTWFERLKTGFQDGATTTGSAYLVQSIWGNLFYSSNHFGRMDNVTQEDLDYVKNALPDDKDAQMFVLLNGRDSEEIKFLVNQKLVDKKRQEKIAQYNDGCIFTLANTGRFLGSVFDPLNFIPIGGAVNGARIVSKLGNAIYDVSKVARIANKASRMGKIVRPAIGAGVSNVPVTLIDNAMQEKFGGINKTTYDYGWDSVNAFLGGAVLGGIGGLFANIRKNPKLANIAKEADHTETKAIENVAGLNDNYKSETIGEALKIHDTTFGKTLKSNYYAKLEKSKRVIATKTDEAQKLLGKYGIDLPKGAKAFYVPNEDYTIVLTDKVAPKEIDSILSHEFGIHAGLKSVIGEKAYNKVIEEVRKNSNQDGHVFNQLRKETGEYDPEELLAYAVEQDKLSDKFVSKLKGYINNGFKRENLKTHITTNQVKEIMKAQLEAKRGMAGGLYFNPDGSTAFAGIRYSKDNPLNPQNIMNFYELEPQITKETQKAIPKPLRWLTKKLEQGYFGSAFNSTSNTIRKYAPSLWDDARGRGEGLIGQIPAEIHKEQIMNRLYRPYLEYASIRFKWCLKNKKLGDSAFKAFDRIVIDAYNAKYAGNTANIIGDVPEEVAEAVEKLHAFRQLEIAIGKTSSKDVGSRYDNLIEADWEAVDHELWRIVDIDKRAEFRNSFNTTEEAVKFLDEYIRAFVKRDIVKKKMERNIAKQNKKIQAYNDKLKDKTKQKDLVSTKVTDSDIDKWIDEHIKGTIDNILNTRTFDPTETENVKGLGSPSFLKTRVPFDTTGVVKMKNGSEFSFDNNLRNYDLDSIIPKNINRFAGECAVKAKFGSQANLDKVLKKAREELGLAQTDLNINKSTEAEQYNEFMEGIDNLRGMRPREEALSKLDVLLRIFSKEAYYTNGANMGFAQSGELSGSIAYGGTSHLFDMIKPLSDTMEDIRWGKDQAELIRDIEAHMFGESIESKIFTVNYGDRVVQEQLTNRKDLTSKALRGTANVVSNLSKVTSAVNFLPKMTDNMIRKMRTQTLVDALYWANGKGFGKHRNPFSEAKLRAVGITKDKASELQETIRKYTAINDEGKITEFNFVKWSQEDPTSYNLFYYMIQKQADRAITPGGRQGNKNLFKDKNAITRLALQFKDYTLRAVNAQTFRMMTACDLDDALNAMLSMFTNAGGFGLKALATYGAMKAIGGDEKAEDYYNRMITSENFIRAGIMRSVIFTPLSFANDILEAGGFVDTTTRTTVTRGSYGQPQEFGDYVGNIVAQMPAVQQAGKLFDIANFARHEYQDDTTKRDFKKFIQAFPLPNHIISTAILNKYLIDSVDYPDKRPKN